MPITSKTSVTNQAGASPAHVALLIANTDYAFQQWAKLLSGNATIEINVNIVNDLGGATLAQASSTESVLLGKVAGRDVYLEGAMAEILSGVDPNGAVADIAIDIDYGEIRSGTLVLDATPNDNGTPFGKYDAITLLMHEIGHGLYMNGWSWESDYASLGYQSAFDRYVSGGTTFVGPNTLKAYGRAVPLAGPHLDEVRMGDRLMDPYAPLQDRVLPDSIDLAMLSDSNAPTTLGDRLMLLPTGGRTDTGAGIDTVVMSQARSAFGVTVDATGATLRMGSVSWQVSNAERVRFADGTLAVDVALPGAGASSAGSAYRLYEAAFNRTPDNAGLTFWIKQFDAGKSTLDVARGFTTSAEFKQVYGANPTSAQFVNGFYQNILGRAPEAAGFNYWNGLLSANAARLPEVLAGIANSAENQAQLVGVIGNGIWLPGDLIA
jgi:hypothetical protein